MEGSLGDESVPRGQALAPWVHVSERLGLLACVRELAAHLELLWALTQREVKVRYKQTVLGVAWAIAQPLMLMLAFTVFFGRFAGISTDGVPYPLFSYAALLPWTFFTTSLVFGVASLVTNTSLVTKVFFPREILPLASVFSASVDFGAAALVYVVLMAIYGVTPTLVLVYIVPLSLVLLVFTAGVTLALAAINVSYRDVRYALPLVTQIWLYATPVIYPLSAVPERVRPLYLAANPMATVVEGYRRVLVTATAPDLSMLALSAGSSVVLLVAAYAYFKLAERSFADVI